MTRPFRDAGGLSGGELLRDRAALLLGFTSLMNRGACDWMHVFPCGVHTHDPSIVLSWVAADGLAMRRCSMDSFGLFSPRSVIQGLNPNKLEQ